jgi:phosphoribosylformylglycinamidine cyclo-ligase
LRARVDLSKLSAGRGKDVWAWMRGFVAEEEMLETFNCGVGMVLVVRRERVRDVLAVLGARRGSLPKSRAD